MKSEPYSTTNINSSSSTQKRNISALFASPFRDSGSDMLADAVHQAIKAIDGLKPQEKKGGAFLGTRPALAIDFDQVKDARLQQSGKSLNDVIHEVVGMFEGLPNWGHPLNMSNICPQENIAAIIASMLTQVFSPNILEGEYAWNTAQAELDSAAILANLAGWDAAKAGGLYTYGGSGCWMYHLKYALSRVLPDSRKKGIRTDAKVICSEQAHYTMQNSTDWTGLGTDNIIQVRTLPDSNVMDLKHLEEILRQCVAANTPVVSVVCTMATTDACAFDPVKSVRQLLDRYPNSEEFGRTLLYCDAVIGWSWLTFRDYDFEVNPLGFAPLVVEAAKRNYDAVHDILHADAFGVDFHKSFAPLASSIFVYRDAEEFEGLLKREEAAYLQERGPYNPHHYTLEVSRSAAGSMSGWATLNFLGAEGFQSVLARSLENKLYLLRQLDEYGDMVCLNSEDDGGVALLRIYPEGINAADQYRHELHDSDHRAALKQHNDLIEEVGELLWKWYREKKLIDGSPTTYLSVTKGFRPALYNLDGKDTDAVVYAVKVYPVSVFTTPFEMDHALVCIRRARDTVLSNRN